MTVPAAVADSAGAALRAGARRSTLAVLGIVAAVSLLLWPTLTSLHSSWTDFAHLTYVHGYLVVALAAWLLWRAAHSADPGFVPDRRAWLPLGLLSLCWLVALRSGIELGYEVLWPVLLWAALWAAAGWRTAARCGFAIGFLYFAIPVWDLGNLALQSLTVSAVKVLLKLTGIAAFVESNVVHIREGIFAIEAGCNGMHFMIVALAIGALFGELHRDTWSMRVRQVALAAAFALLANWLRVYGVILAGHLTDMQHYIVRVSHYYFGWMVFAACMSIYFWIVSRAPLRERGAPGPGELGAGAPPRLVAALPAVVIAGLGGLLGAVAPGPAPLSSGPLLPPVRDWQGPLPVGGDWQPQFAGHDRAENGAYRHSDLDAQAYIAEYTEQRQGKELVGYGNSPINGIPGDVLAADTVPVAGGPARLLVVGDRWNSSVVLYYYEIGARRRVNGLPAQLTYGLASLLRPTASRIVSVRVGCAPDCGAAAERARQLLDGITAARAAE